MAAGVDSVVHRHKLVTAVSISPIIFVCVDLKKIGGYINRSSDILITECIHHGVCKLMIRAISSVGFLRHGYSDPQTSIQQE